jgi:hypothetical protein
VTPTFYLDEDVAVALTRMLQELGRVATHTHAEAMDRSRDYQQLLHAATHSWVLVTHNARDFRLLHGAWLTWAHEWGISHRHSGILIVEQLPPPRHSEIAQAIDAFMRSPMTTFDNMLFEWMHRAGWQPFRP